MWPGANGLTELTETFGPKRGVEHTFKNGGIRRQTIVKSAMIIRAGLLLRDVPQDGGLGACCRGRSVTGRLSAGCGRPCDDATATTDRRVL